MKLNGFSLIEILIVIALFSILASLALFFSIDFFRTYATNSEQVNLVSALSKARAKSLANINRSAHGVRITPSSYTIFQGTSFASRDASKDQVIEINSALNPTLSTDIVFEQLTAKASCSNGCTITMSGNNGSKTVTINSEGTIIW